MEDRLQELIEACLQDIVIKIKLGCNKDLEVSLSYMDYEFCYDSIDLDELKNAD
jgi:hypothetical protein